jgi:hypothetical protein
MIHNHLPHLLGHISSALRHATGAFHHIRRIPGIALCRLRLGRDAVRAEVHRFQRRRADPKRGRNYQPPLLLHYHIFKNAGTSFQSALRLGLRGGVRTLDDFSHDGIIRSHDIASYLRHNPRVKVILSHQAAPPPPKLPGREVLSSILLRDPIARIRSIYAFERVQVEDTPPGRKAKELDFKRYVEWRLEATPRMLCNYQVHFCSRGAGACQPLPDADNLREAIRVLDSIDIVGTVERFEEFLALAEAILTRHFPAISLRALRENASNCSREYSQVAILNDLVSDLGEALASELLHCNELDMSLHQVADALLTRKLAEHRVRVSLQQLYQEARVRIR